jgi:hypothetical protein
MTVTYSTPCCAPLLEHSQKWGRLDNATEHAASVGLIVLVPEVTSARTVKFTLDELYRHAEAAVVGEVHGVVSAAGHRYADIQVHEVLKGEAEPVIRVIAESTWRCDASDALEPGTRVLLFLGRRDAAAQQAVPMRGYVPFAGRDRVQRLSGAAKLPGAIAESVQRQELHAVLTTEVFARYLATLD